MNNTGFPSIRMRRMRQYDFSRRLVRETNLSVDDLIYPIFIIEGEKSRLPVKSMPGIERLSIDELLIDAKQAFELGIPAIAMFPVIPDEKKSDNGEEAYNQEGLLQRAVRALKSNIPELGIITELESLKGNTLVLIQSEIDTREIYHYFGGVPAALVPGLGALPSDLEEMIGREPHSSGSRRRARSSRSTSRNRSTSRSGKSTRGGCGSTPAWVAVGSRPT